MEELPGPLADAAPAAWHVGTSRGSPAISDTRMMLLCFGISRELLTPADLIQLYKVEDGLLYSRGDPTGGCLLSARKGRSRQVHATRTVRRGRKAQGAPTEVEKQKALARFKLPQWVCGTRLKFQSDRWCVAPPQPSAAVELLESRLEDEQELGAPCEIDVLREQLKLKKKQRAVFVPVSRLLCFHKHKGPHTVFGRRSDASRALALHYACTRSPESRARCLNHHHMAWGSEEDNAYHRVVHGSNADSDSDPDFAMPASQRRPLGWQSPSTLPNFIRKRDRLKRFGTSKLRFD